MYGATWRPALVGFMGYGRTVGSQAQTTAAETRPTPREEQTKSDNIPDFACATGFAAQTRPGHLAIALAGVRHASRGDEDGLGGGMGGS